MYKLRLEVTIHRLLLEVGVQCCCDAMVSLLHVQVQVKDDWCIQIANIRTGHLMYPFSIQGIAIVRL